jgi:hypothetical protein
MRGLVYLLDEPEAVIIAEDLDLYRVESDLIRYRCKNGDVIPIPPYARRQGTLKTDGEITGC